jgi:adenylylsulfate kinase-like enzyme
MEYIFQPVKEVQVKEIDDVYYQIKQQQIQEIYQGVDIIYEDPDQEHQGTLNSFVESKI